MNRLSKWIVKCRYAILIAAVILLIPATIQYKMTRINYDVLTYLSKEHRNDEGTADNAGRIWDREFFPVHG